MYQLTKSLLIISLVPMSFAARVFLCGDSTMAKGGGGGGTQGWGEYLKEYITLAVVNEAHAGTSARSYTTTGRFDAVAEQIAAGDFVIMEFGHNDGGEPSRYLLQSHHLSNLIFRHHEQ